MKDRSVAYVVTVLAPLVFSFAMALDLYIPTVPEIAQVFHTNQSTVQLTLSLFMLTQGVGQLLFGPLSDQVGRKPVALCSAAIFCFASLGCAISVNVVQLIVWRIVEAAGACGMTVVAFAMVRDLFERDLSARVFSYLNSTIAVSPLLAPVIGGQMAVWLGWRSNFYLLAGIGVACMALVAFFMTETQAHHHKVRFDLGVFKRYRSIFCQRAFFPYVLLAACAISVFFCFFSISPFIIISLLHVPETHFGYYFAVLGVVFLVGSALAGKLTPRIGARAVLLSGIVLLFFGAVMMLGWYQLFGLSMAEFLVPLLFAGLGASFIAGSSAGLALERFGHMAGTAASLLGATQFMGSSIAGSIMMHRMIVSTQPYAVTLLVLSVVAFVCYRIAPAEREAS